MKINTNEHKRAFFLFVLFSLWVLAVAISLVKVQVFDYSKNISRVRAQSNRIFSLHPKRGTIYDSNGEVLAISIKAKSAFLSNKNNTQSMALFNSIRKQVRLTYKEIKNIKKRIRRGDKFIWVKRKLSDYEYEKLAKIKKTIKGKSLVDFVEEYKRIYPQKTTACHLLGGVGIDEQGLYGIEYAADSIIRGKGGKAKVMRDARRKIFKLKYLTKPVPGKNIYLTINSTIQFFVEKELKKTVENFKAKSGTVIVMDSRSGSILAMAGYPTFKPDNIRYTSNKIVKNPAISFLYHPGSTFKIILASVALEKNICSPKQSFFCYNGKYKVKDKIITDVHPYERLNFQEIIIYSSNIGAAKIAEKLGKNNYYQGIKNFGFGDRIGIQLPAEERGIVHPLNKWSGVSLDFLADGYEIAVTPLQMIRAFNVISSGGYLVYPTILKKINDSPVLQKQKVKIISPETVDRMTDIMMQVVKIGTGKKTRIRGINIAGKTGTTKKINSNKSLKKYISSFGGFFPAKDPQITMFVMINEPQGLFYGSDVAAPLFKSIAKQLIIHLKIIPNLDLHNEIKI
jgi:cell division protein FtsI (penicillin-binding protein 3)